MRHFKPLLLIALSSIMLGVSCGKEFTPPEIPTTDKLALKVSPEVNGQPFELNKWYTTPSGQEYMLGQFKFYLGNIELVRGDNNTALFEDVVLAEADPTVVGSQQVGLAFNNDKVVMGVYKGLRLGMGVPPNIASIKNGTYDPSKYTIDHPLSSAYNMTWMMAGYKHVFMEGKFKKPAGDTGDINYHIALDTFYIPKEFTGNIVVAQGKSNTATIALDMNKLFEPNNVVNRIDLATENMTHSKESSQKEMDVAQKVSHNLTEALQLK